MNVFYLTFFTFIEQNYNGMLRNISKVTFDLIAKGIPEAKDRIISEIFSIDRVISSIYSLKPEIRDTSGLKSKLEEISNLDYAVIADLLDFFKSNEIDLKMPENLKGIIKLKPQNVAFFVGAGASKLLGYPTWTELADKALDELESRNLISCHEKEMFQKDISDPKVKLSLFETTVSENGTFQFYKERLKVPEREVGTRNVYDLLVSEVFHDCIKMTTNVDSEFIRAFMKFKPLDFKENNTAENPDKNQFVISNLKINPSQDLRSDVIYYLHGYIEGTSEELIFSTEKYLKYYFREGKEDKSELKLFLEKVFEECTVVFIGSGLEELQILETIGNKGGPHYALMGTYTNNIQFLELKAQYLRSLNVEIIPYYLDNEKWNRLYRVIEAWKNEMTVPIPKGIDYAILIKEDLEGNDQSPQLLSMLKQDMKIHVYILEQSIDTKKWFYKFKNEGFLKSSYIRKNDDLLFRTILFLKRAIKRALLEKDEKLTNDIVDLVNEYLEEKIHNNDESLYSYLVYIIQELPIKNIDKQLIDHLIQDVDFSKDTPLLSKQYHLFDTFFEKLISDSETGRSLAFHLLYSYYSENTNKKNFAGEKYELGIFEKGSKSESFRHFAHSITCEQMISLCELFSLSNLKKYKEFLMTIDSESYNAGLTVLSSKEIEVRIYNKTNDYQPKKTPVFENKIEFSLFDHSENKLLEKVNYITKGYGTISDLGIQYFTGLFFNEIRNIFEIEHSRNSLHEDIFIIILSIVKTKTNDGLDEFISYLLNEKYKDINLKRILIYLLHENWDKYNSHFIYILENYKLFFHETSFEQDLRVLFRNNVALMTQQEKQKLFDTINKSCVSIENTEGPSHQREYCLYKWFSALENDEFFKFEATKYSLLLNLRSDHFNNKGRIQWSGFHSPWNKGEMLIKDSHEIIQMLKSFKGDWKEGTSVDQLASVFSDVIFHNENRFGWILTEYNSIPYVYAYYIINNYKLALQNNTPISWNYILTFIEKYISGINFTSDTLSCDYKYNDSRNDVLSEISSLIEMSSTDDNRSFPETEEGRIKDILLKCVSFEEINEERIIDDYVSYTLNSYTGKKLHAIIQLSLKLARKNDSRLSNNWEAELRKAFEKYLENESLSSYILIGMFYPQFCYLDQSWTINKVSRFINLPDSNWKGFMSGLMLQGARGTKDTFEKTIKQHYLRAIENDFFQDDRIKFGFVRSVIQLFCWGYIDSNDELISLFIKNSNEEVFINFIKQIGFDKKEIINVNTAEKNKLLVKRILELWDIIQYATNKYKCYSHLVLWFNYIDSINIEHYHRMKSVCESFTNESLIFDFWDEINRLKDKGENKETVGFWISDILLTTLEKDLSKYSVICETAKEIVDYLKTLESSETLNNCHEIQNLLIEKYSCSTSIS